MVIRRRVDGPGKTPPAAADPAALLLPPRARRNAEGTAAAVAALQAGWPEAVLLRAAATSIYDYFPYLFVEAFPGIADSDLQQFATAARLYASSVFLQDRVYDRPGERAPTAALAPVNALRILAMQWEAYRILHRLFPPEAHFWTLFQGYLAEFARAALEEHTFAVGGRPWRELSEELALAIARGKNGVAKATVAGLAELARDASRTAALTAALDHYSVARQALDDLCDWKEDLQNGVPSLVLTRALANERAAAGPREQAALVEAVGREIYYGGHASYSLELAVSALDEADRLTADVPDLSWRKVNAELRQRCQRLLQDTERIIDDNLRRTAGQPAFRLRLPPPAGPWQRLGWDALRFVAGQWRLGFGEARHLMEFPRRHGFSAEHELQRGDVFQRAVIADVLCDADELLGGALGPALEREIAYLLGRRGPARGGWRYFPELPELPPDADDLAQVMQVLVRRGRLDEVRRHCAGPLSLLLEDNRHADGSFETWIIPASGRTPEEELQARAARERWGTGADPEVVANLLYALHLFDGGRFAAEIRRGAEYLRRQQREDGSWTSTWYRGPYYGTYACLRFLRQVSPRSPAVGRAAELLRREQRADGGWGSAGESEPLDTALALLGLATLGGEGAGPAAAAAARAYLRRTRQGDGSWPACDFIRMDTGRASGAEGLVLTYGSATMTTAFVLKAALAWHRLTGARPLAAPRVARSARRAAAARVVARPAVSG